MDENLIIGPDFWNKEKEIIKEIKENNFPQATERDWEILGIYYNKIKLDGDRNLNMVVAKQFFPKDSHFEVLDMIDRFNKQPINIGPDASTVHLNPAYIMLTKNSFNDLKHSMEWYTYLFDVYFETRAVTKDNSNIHFLMNDLTNKLISAWKKRNPNEPDATIPKPQTSSFVITELLYPLGNSQCSINGQLLTNNFKAEQWATNFFMRYFRITPQILSASKKGKINIEERDLLDLPGQISGHGLTDSFSKKDMLGFELYAQAIYRFFKHPKTTSPLTLGIFGKWGEGKTNLLEFIKKCFDADDEKHKWYENPFKKLEHPTIWVNAWKYENSNQVLAGFANNFINQLSKQMKSPVLREVFFFRLWLKRISGFKFRNFIYLSSFTIFLTAFFLLLMKFIFIKETSWTDLLKDKTIILPSFLIATLPIYVEVLKNIFKKTDGFLRETDHKDQTGYLSEVESDLKFSLNYLVSNKKPAILFIDDLDRCSPKKISETLETINLFLAGKFSNVFVLMALDVRVAVEAFSHLDNHNNKKSVGWAFLEKFINLYFCLPALTPNRRGIFITQHFHKKENTTPPATKFVKVSKNGEVSITEFSNSKSENLNETFVTAEEAYDDMQKLLPIIGRYTNYVGDTPRSMKRFVNLFKFYQAIEFVRKTNGEKTASTEQLALWAVIMTKWPELVQWIQWSNRSIDKRTPIERAKHFDDITNPDLGFNTWLTNLTNLKLDTIILESQFDLYELLSSRTTPALTLFEAVRLGVW